MGAGEGKGKPGINGAKDPTAGLLPKMELDIVVGDAIADEVVKAVTSAARTGEIGDGRVFVLPVEESYRIRTGELLRD